MAKRKEKDENDDDDDEMKQESSSTTTTPTKKQKVKKESKKSSSKKSIDSTTASAAAETEDMDTTTPTDAADSSGPPKKTYEERCRAVNVLSHPLASKKSTKLCYKLVKKASSQKHVRRGVKELVKGLRKGDRGLAILAGDVYPIDVMSHLPILLEDYHVPYLFVPSKQDLGAAASTKRPTSCVLIKTPATLKSTAQNKKKSKEGDSKDVGSSTGEFDGQDLYDTLVQEAKEYNPTKL